MHAMHACTPLRPWLDSDSIFTMLGNYFSHRPLSLSTIVLNNRDWGLVRNRMASGNFML